MTTLKEKLEVIREYSLYVNDYVDFYKEETLSDIHTSKFTRNVTDTKRYAFLKSLSKKVIEESTNTIVRCIDSGDIVPSFWDSWATRVDSFSDVIKEPDFVEFTKKVIYRNVKSALTSISLLQKVEDNVKNTTRAAVVPYDLFNSGREFLARRVPCIRFGDSLKISNKDLKKEFTPLVQHGGYLVYVLDGLTEFFLLRWGESPKYNTLMDLNKADPYYIKELKTLQESVYIHITSDNILKRRVLELDTFYLTDRRNLPYQEEFKLDKLTEKATYKSLTNKVWFKYDKFLSTKGEL